MTTYMILMKMTPEGTKHIKSWPASIDDSIKAFEAMGGKLVGFYASSVLYDYIGIGEAPNDEIAEQFRRLVEAGGAIDAEVIRLYTKDEFENIIDRIKTE